MGMLLSSAARSAETVAPRGVGRTDVEVADRLDELDVGLPVVERLHRRAQELHACAASRRGGSGGAAGDGIA